MNLTELLRSPEPPKPLGIQRSHRSRPGTTTRPPRRSGWAPADVSAARWTSPAARTCSISAAAPGRTRSTRQGLPGLRATVFDLPPVVVVTAEYLDQHGVSDRVGTVGGDFTSDPFPDCDVIVMASNLPIYDEPTIGAVVAKAFDALEPGGEMHLVGEMLDDDGVGPLDAALWGMQEILYHSGGKAHRRSQVRGYFTDAGFVDVAEDEFVPGVLVRVSGRKPA
ncbi:MAG: methyltransferase [Acidimicrobiales bacterium]